MYPGWHVQEPASFLSVHLAFDPQGEGKHGFTFTDVSSTKRNKRSYRYVRETYFEFLDDCLIAAKISDRCKNPRSEVNANEKMLSSQQCIKIFLQRSNNSIECIKNSYWV